MKMEIILKIYLKIFLVISVLIVSGCDAMSNLIDKEKAQYTEDLNSENLVVKKEALDYFRDNPEDSVEELIINAVNDESDTIKVAAIESIGSNQYENAVDVLIPLLKSSKEDIVKSSIVSLGKIGEEKKSISALVPLLKKKDYQIEVIWALGNIGSKDAVKPLSELLSSSDKYVVYNATMALKLIR